MIDSTTYNPPSPPGACCCGHCRIRKQTFVRRSNCSTPLYASQSRSFPSRPLLFSPQNRRLTHSHSHSPRRTYSRHAVSWRWCARSSGKPKQRCCNKQMTWEICRCRQTTQTPPILPARCFPPSLKLTIAHNRSFLSQSQLSSAEARAFEHRQHAKEAEETAGRTHEMLEEYVHAHTHNNAPHSSLPPSFS